MLNKDATIPTKTRVAYVADPRITGTVVGHGTVHGGDDPTSDSLLTYHVVIVKLDRPSSIPPGHELSFHTPFVPSVLTIID